MKAIKYSLVLLPVFFFALLFKHVTAQSVDDTFQEITTLVSSIGPGFQSSGTAFFYQQLGEAIPTQDGTNQWRKTTKIWLVTNRHVLVPRINDREVFPSVFTFHLRKKEGIGLKWEQVTITQDELIKRAKFHPDSSVDVCVVDIFDILANKFKPGGDYLAWGNVSKEMFVGQNKIHVGVGDDVLVIGYPRGYYDDVNLFPIVKAGIIASKWGVRFRGNRHFLVDAKLFPQSSGSLVVSKPTQFVTEAGKAYLAKNKQFAFLGILSSEPYIEGKHMELDGMRIIEKAGLNLCIVWYADVIEEIINGGVTFKSS